MENKIIIDKNKCIGCKKCINDCPANNMELVNKKAEIFSNNCLMCGHCVAVCPKVSIYISGFDDDVEEIEKTILNPEEYLKSIKTRRSIRNFKDIEIDEKIIKMIIEAGRYSPTAKNHQDVSYIILKDKKREFEDIAVGFFRKLSKVAKPFSSEVRKIEIDDKFFFKGAPLVILVIAKSEIDGSLAAQNMATMAEAHDLGVLFSGFFTAAANKCKEIKDKLELDKKEKVITTLVIGYPGVRYLRTTNRKTAKVKEL